MIHPLIGPIIKEVNKEVFTDNEYFIFDLPLLILSLVWLISALDFISLFCGFYYVGGQ